MSDPVHPPMRLQPTVSAPAIARAHVSEACRGRLSPEAVEAARLLVSELVTNCVRHAHTMITLAVDCDDRCVAVAVGDDGEELPVVRDDVDDDSTGGRGLHLVEALSGEWGVRTRDDGGKVVWFRLP
ncbi:MAG TPA: ATP-binding protein [Mycobacteriales bacterium]|nr:ATP-binding protein [Mycobacteriales bacterium]